MIHEFLQSRAADNEDAIQDLTKTVLDAGVLVSEAIDTQRATLEMRFLYLVSLIAVPLKPSVNVHLLGQKF